MKPLRGIAVFLLLIAPSTPAQVGQYGRSAAPEGWTEAKEIVLGQSCALSGPAQALGKGMQLGLRACFEEVNVRGGIRGRAIRLISRDDGYEPDRAIRNTRDLIERDRVFLLIGEVGTPTSKAVLPMAERAGVPFFGPFTGAEFLRSPFRRHVVNVRGSYYQEMERLAQYLVDLRKLEKIACFYQNDDYGQAGLEGICKALSRRKMHLVAEGTYERNSLAVKSGLLRIRKACPQAVVMVGAYEPCAEFIRVARRIGMSDVLYCNISFVGSDALRAELGEDGEGCIISQVVACPWESGVPLVEEYTAALARSDPEAKPGFVSFEGYIVGRLFCEVAAGVEGDLTRAKFLDQVAATGVFDLGGLVLRYGERDHQGMDEVFLTVIRGGKIVPLRH